MTFNKTAIDNLLSNLRSGAKALGMFNNVVNHEPKNAPGDGMTLAIWLSSFRLSNKFSGLAAVSGVVTLNHRIYVNFKGQPEEETESRLLNGLATLMAEYASEFTFGSTVLAVDLLGMDSSGLSATTGYVEIDKAWFRMADLTVSIILDNMWIETP